MVRLKGNGFYAVARGRTPGIYQSWPECEEQIKGFPNARFKKFASEAEALFFIQDNQVPRPRGARKAPMEPPPGAVGRPPVNGGGPSMVLHPTLPLQVNNPYLGMPNMGGVGNGGGALSHAPLPFNDFDPTTFLQSLLGSQSVPTSSTSNRAPMIPQKQAGLEDPRPHLPKKRTYSTSAGNGDIDTHVPKRRNLEHVNWEGAPVVYTDGACSRNGRHNAMAGYGVWWADGDPNNEWGAVDGEQTNNRAELKAVIRAIEKAQAIGHTRLLVRTDSKLLISSMESWVAKWKQNGWTTAGNKPVKNQDLLMMLDVKLDQLPVRFEHVAGHAGIHGNEMADKLAKHGASESSRLSGGNRGY